MVTFLEPTVEEGVVYRFPVLEQHHTQILAIRFINPAPAPNAAISLHGLCRRIGDDTLDPCIANLLPIGSLSDVQEVLSALHVEIVPDDPMQVEPELRATLSATGSLFCSRPLPPCEAGEEATSREF